MKTAAVICEFNPFHNGHALLAHKVREEGATHIIGIMSGSFTQRGEPSVRSVSARVSAALENGFDVMLQLPVNYAVSGASVFASGGAAIAHAAGCVDFLAFGSECGSVSKLEKAAGILRSGETDKAIMRELSSGITYARARENAVRTYDPESADILRNPNDILAVEYINALHALSSSVKPLAIKREGSGHEKAEITGCITSSSEIRRRMEAGEEWKCFVPENADFGTENPVDMKKFETLMLHKMRSISASELCRCPDISEGIENRLIASASQASSLEEFYSLAKTKRYTHSRIRHITLSALLGITKEDTLLPVPYIRLLGFGERGAEVVRLMGETAKLPVLSKTADIKDLSDEAKKVFALECAAGDVYSLLLKDPLPCGEEKKFTVIKKQ